MIRFSFILAICLSFGANIFAQSSIPKTIVLESEILSKNLAESKLKPNPAIVEIIKDAEKIVKAGKLYSVMNKQQNPPSGNKHDYMSQAPYWWADPSKPNGLPYIRRDGERNPELKKITDEEELGKMRNEVEVTAIAYFYSGRDEFAKHSADLIRTWFLAENTKMNPNLNFAQGIPGINTGRGLGLIETRELYRVIDSAILLQSSKFWTGAEHSALKKWFGDFAKWMTDSSLGKDEAKAKNNHGTYYDVQLISFLIFTDQIELAKKQLEISKNRIKDQMNEDGSLPKELERTLSWDYSFMNLFGFFTIARLAENIGVNFWNFESDGKGIKNSLEWHKSFVKNEKQWTYQQIRAPKMDNAFRVFSIAARKYKIKDYQDLTDKIKKEAKLTELDLVTR